MSDDESFRALERLWDESTEAQMELLVAQLRAIHAAKKAARGEGAAETTKLPVGELLFDLAKLHAKILGDLAAFSASQTDALVRALKKRRAEAEGGRRRPPVLVLVSPTMAARSGAQESFKLRNDADRARAYRIPGLVELRRAGEEAKGSVFIEVRPEPERVVVDRQSERVVTLTFPWNNRLAAGRYQGRLRMEAEEEADPSVELIIELAVEPSAAEPPRSP
jgi:hypothetical protein